MEWTINRYLDIVDADGEIIIHTDSGVYMPDEKKYLPLILHAPEMLEMLKQLQPFFKTCWIHYYDDGVWWADKIKELLDRVKED